MKELTDIQTTTLDLIKRFIDIHGYSPTYRDIAKMRGISSKAAYDVVQMLCKKGVLICEPWKSRSINIINES